MTSFNDSNIVTLRFISEKYTFYKFFKVNQIEINWKRIKSNSIVILDMHKILDSRVNRVKLVESLTKCTAIVTIPPVRL